ncbi:MAG: divergent PAP2 family protein [Oscillospiraceae bacterium]|nr:divergent PAP2 family protein [Oscillospiraceae bacterium]
MIAKMFSGNYILCVAAFAWIAAQALKTLINYIIVGKFDAERLFGAGGMPSSHSALVCSMVIACAKVVGVHSPIFAIAFLLAGIVMYDAMGVRRETGNQAKILNKILLDWMNDDNPDNNFLPNGKKLKELVGHTPFEVLGGALLGILIGVLIPLPM